jgi:hypothetical protein
MKQSITSSSSAGIDVIEARNIVNDVVVVIETPAEDITLNLDSEELHYLCQETNHWDILRWVYRF